VRILILSNLVPYPLYGGVQLRVFHLARRIAARHEVTLGCHSWDDQDVQNAALLSRKYFSTVCGPVYPFRRRHVIPAISAALRGVPPETVQYHAPILRELVRTGNFDIVQVEESILAPYADAIPPGAATRTVLTFHNIHFVQARRIASVEPHAFGRIWGRTKAAWMRSYEPRLARRFHRSIAVTEADKTALAATVPGTPIDVLPNGVDTGELRPLPAPDGGPAILFVGSMNYRPCIDAAVWLVQDILPLLRQRLPGVNVWIAGRNPAPEVKVLAAADVHVTGAVPDVEPFYRKTAVTVVPLRAGGGSRLKILESMALGRPIVTTAIGAEGIALRDGQEALFAEDPAQFVNAILRLVEDPALWHSIAANARRYVETHHDWNAIAGRQLDIYDELAAGAR